MKTENLKKVDLELRPHHIPGYLAHEIQPELYALSDDEYIALFRKVKGEDPADQHKEGQHTDELILHQRDTFKKLHDNPSTEFKYIKGLDTVCRECKNQGICSEKQHWAYKIVQEADSEAEKGMPELKYEKNYDGNYLKGLFRKKGWLKNQEKSHSKA